MQALTRLNPTDPVRFDGMNTILGEIEARDEDLLNKINVLSKDISSIGTTRKLKTYISLKDLELTNESTFPEIAAAMPNNSSLEFSSYNPLNWFPASVTGDRNDVEIKRYSGGVDYIKVKLSNVKIGVWHGYYTEQTGLVWEKIATTTKTSFLCTAQAGCTIVSQNCYTLNGEFCIELRIKKIDGSTFISGETVVAMLPLIPVAVYPCCVTARAGTSSWNLFAHAYIGTNKEIRVCCNNGISSGVTELFITCKGGVA